MKCIVIKKKKKTRDHCVRTKRTNTDNWTKRIKTTIRGTSCVLYTIICIDHFIKEYFFLCYSYHSKKKNQSVSFHIKLKRKNYFKFVLCLIQTASIFILYKILFNFRQLKCFKWLIKISNIQFVDRKKEVFFVHVGISSKIFSLERQTLNLYWNAIKMFHILNS